MGNLFLWTHVRENAPIFYKRSRMTNSERVLYFRAPQKPYFFQPTVMSPSPDILHAALQRLVAECDGVHSEGGRRGGGEEGNDDDVITEDECNREMLQPADGAHRARQAARQDGR